MPVFTIPREYGIGGVADAIRGVGNAIDEGQETRRRREREDFVFDEAKRDSKRAEEDDIIQRYGQGSPEHMQWLRDNEMSDANILIPLEVRKDRRRTELESKVTAGTATPAEQGEFNALNGDPILGYEAEVESLQRRADFEEIQLKVAEYSLREAQLKEEDRERFRSIMQTKYNMTPAELDAAMAMTGYQQAQANLGLTNSNIRATDALANERNTDASGNFGIDLVDARRIAADLRKFDPTITLELVTRVATGRGTPEEEDKVSRAQGMQTLQPARAKLNEELGKVNEEIARLRLEFAKEQAKDDKSPEVLAQLNAEIVRQNQIRHRLASEFNTLQRQTLGNRGVTTPTNTPASSVATTTSTVAEEYPAELVAETRQAYKSVADIEALDATDEEKEILKAIWLSGNQAATSAVETARTQAPPPARAGIAARLNEGDLRIARDTAGVLRSEISTLEARLQPYVGKDINSRSIPDSVRADIRRWRRELADKKARLERIEGIIGGS